MTYADAVAFLDRLTDYERVTGYRYDTRSFGPDRTRALLDRLGHPERACPCVVVAGTKGKGSTSAMLASILEAAVGRVGLYTSPHLVRWTERIRIGGEPVGEDEFAGLAALAAPPVAALEAGGADMRPTTFEVLTAMALAGFERRGVRAAVLEVGLGGRLDAVNAVDACAVIVTPVSIDHVDQLGGTIDSIAREKAGVIRLPVPVVSGPQPPEAEAVVEAACRTVGAPLLVVGRDLVAPAVTRCDPAGSRFDARTPKGDFPGLEIPLAGRHQIANALAAVGCALVGPFAVSEDAIRHGLKAVRWPGRLEILRPGLLVDGAHNEASAEALAVAVREIWGSPRLGLVFAQLRGKEHAEVARRIVPLAARVWCPSLAHPRALPADDLAAVVRAAGGRAETCADVRTALLLAREEFAGSGDLVLATGSLALVGEVMLVCSAA